MSVSSEQIRGSSSTTRMRRAEGAVFIIRLLCVLDARIILEARASVDRFRGFGEKKFSYVFPKGHLTEPSRRGRRWGRRRARGRGGAIGVSGEERLTNHLIVASNVNVTIPPCSAPGAGRR